MQIKRRDLRPFRAGGHLWMHMAPNLPPDLPESTIAAAQAGDDSAFAAIHRHYGDRIFTLILRMVSRRALAEDLFQDVFIEVLRSIPNYSHAGSFGGWLRAIAVNKTLSYLRSPWHRSLCWLEDQLQSESATVLEAAIEPVAVDDHRELLAALEQLTPLSRAVVLLYDVEGYTHAEIARALGRTISFSKSQLSRAHSRLRDLLNESAHQSQPHRVPNEKSSCLSAPNSLSISS